MKTILYRSFLYVGGCISFGAFLFGGAFAFCLCGYSAVMGAMSVAGLLAMQWFFPRLAK